MKRKAKEIGVLAAVVAAGIGLQQLGSKGAVYAADQLDQIIEVATGEYSPKPTTRNFVFASCTYNEDFEFSSPEAEEATRYINGDFQPGDDITVAIDNPNGAPSTMLEEIPVAHLSFLTKGYDPTPCGEDMQIVEGGNLEARTVAAHIAKQEDVQDRIYDSIQTERELLAQAARSQTKHGGTSQ